MSYTLVDCEVIPVQKVSRNYVKLQDKVAVSSFSNQVISPSAGYDAMSSVILSGIDTSSVNVTSGAMLENTFAYDASGTLIEGNLESLDIPAGYEMVINNLSSITVPAGVLNNTVSIRANATNIEAENIRNGVSILGVTGTLEPGGGSGSETELSFSHIADKAIDPYQGTMVDYVDGFATGYIDIHQYNYLKIPVSCATANFAIYDEEHNFITTYWTGSWHPVVELDDYADSYWVRCSWDYKQEDDAILIGITTLGRD